MNNFFIAASPIAAIAILMLGFRWTASRAGAAALLLAVLIAWLGYDFIGRPFGTAATGVLAESSFAPVTILWIIFPALCIYNLQFRTEAIETLQQWLVGLAALRCWRRSP